MTLRPFVCVAVHGLKGLLLSLISLVAAVCLLCIGVSLAEPVWRAAPLNENSRHVFDLCDKPTPSSSAEDSRTDAQSDKEGTYYTRQQWTRTDTLRVQVWKWSAGGEELVGVDTWVDDGVLTIAPQWKYRPSVHDGGPLLACLVKEGVEVTFRGLPPRTYRIRTPSRAWDEARATAQALGDWLLRR